MAKLNTNTNETTEVVKGTPRVTRVNLVNVETRPWLVAFVNMIYEGTIFMNSVVVRENKEGNAYLTFPNKKRTNKDGSDYLDENGKPVYDAYYGPADADTRKHLEEMVFAAVQDKLDGKDTPEVEKGAEKVIVHLVENMPGVVAFCNVVATGKFFMTGVTVNEVQNGDNKGNVYLQYPSRKRTKAGADVLDDNGKPVYDPYYGPATKEDNEKLLEMAVAAVQAELDKKE